MHKSMKRFGAVLLAVVLAIAPVSTRMTVRADNRAGVIRGSVVNVRTSPSTDAAKAGSLSSNTSVTVTGEVQGSDGKTWYAVSGGGISGYVRSDYVKFPTQYTTDSDFESYLNQQGFPESYKSGLRQLHAEFPNWVFKAFHTNLDWNTVLDAELSGTGSLVESSSVSSWKSTDTGKYDWSTSTWPGFDGAAWVAASREIVAYYMDPRNFLDESYVFQFLEQSYKEGTQNLSGLQSMLKDTFMDKSVDLTSDSTLLAGRTQQTGSTAETSAAEANTGAVDFSAPGEGSIATSVSSTETTASAEASANSSDTVTVSEGPGGALSQSSGSSVPGGSTTGSSQASYAEIIMEAAQQSGVSPYVLAAMILQEQGDGTSSSISGSGGYYNFFNVGAYATSDMTAIQRGLWYAAQSGSYNRPWTSIEKSIVGGALFYAENYLNAGQNTLYLKKWNVQGSNMYKHQYMTNVPGASEEGAKLSAAYSSEMKSAAHEFSIPVYLNMPETAAAKPTGDGSPNNKLSGLTVSGFTLTPGFHMDTEQYTLVVDPSVTEVNVGASQAESHAQISGTGTVQLGDGTTTVTVTVTAQNGTTRNYQILISRASGGQTGGQNASAEIVTSAGQTDSSGYVVVGEAP